MIKNAPAGRANGKQLLAVVAGVNQKVETEIWQEFLVLNAHVVGSNMKAHLALDLKLLILGWDSRRK